jgi:hypothetical protein
MESVRVLEMSSYEREYYTIGKFKDKTTCNIGNVGLLSSVLDVDTSYDIIRIVDLTNFFQHLIKAEKKITPREKRGQIPGTYQLLERVCQKLKLNGVIISAPEEFMKADTNQETEEAIMNSLGLTFIATYDGARLYQKTSSPTDPG